MLRFLPLALAMLPFAASAETLEALVEERASAQLADRPVDAASWRITSHPEVGEVALLARFWIDPRTGQFLADALLETGETQRVSGVALAVANVPVPVRRLMPDEIVSDADLADLEVPLARLPNFAVTDRGDLVGQEVRRMLAEGRPVMAQSIMAPRAVTRGQRVTISLREGGLALSAPGRALGDAARGEIVKVVNLSTNASVSGTAAASGVVEVIR
jgi:flagella basal body P-ring formation protein FlgA